MHDFDFGKKSDDFIKGLKGENDMYRMLFHANPNVMLVVDPCTAVIIQANRAAEEFYGYCGEEFLGMGMSQIDGASEEDVLEIIDAAETGVSMFNVKSRLSDGTLRDAKMFSTPVEIDGKTLLYISVFPVDLGRDGIEEEHPMVRKYFQMALHDELTELPNKRFLKMKIEEEMKRSDREDSEFALIFIDMDNFKRVNDDFGHVTGDKLLSMVGQRLKNSVRGNDFAARFGGDEFGIILSGIKDKDAAHIIAKRIIGCFENPFTIDGKWIEIKCSMGMSVYPEDGADFNELIRAADVEMYNEKKNNELECVSVASCSARFYR